MKTENLSKIEVPPLLRVALIFNSKRTSDPAEAEYDNPETIKAIENALTAERIQIIPLEADEFIMETLRDSTFDFAFNIAEGKNGRGREAQIPAILEMLGIPYSGSDPTTLCLSMDKALCKNYLNSYDILSPRSIALDDDLSHTKKLNFPILLKPNAEGSSKGILDACLIKSFDELKAATSSKSSILAENIIAEEYIDGREFTVGILGNGDNVKVFEPMEIVFKHADTNPIYSYEVKQDYKKFVQYDCPSSMSTEKTNELKALAEKIYRILACRDFARIDFRFDKEENFRFIEINPLPGLAPNYSDFPMLANFCGYSYNDLVRSVFINGMQRVNSGFSGSDYYE